MVGEIVFTTAMTGYLEDPDRPQLLRPDRRSRPSPSSAITASSLPTLKAPAPGLSAYIVRERCEAPSNFRCEGDLDAFLKAQGIPGLWGIDTRALTKVIRESGVMNAFLTTDKSKVPAGAELCKPYVIRAPWTL